MAVSEAVIHAPHNALPLSALLFLVTSLVISSPPICAFLPPHPYCLSSLSLPPYTPIAHSLSVPFQPFQCCFVPFRPFPRFLSSFFPVPFAPSRSVPVPLAARFPFLSLLSNKCQICGWIILSVVLFSSMFHSATLPCPCLLVVLITLVVPSDCCPLNNINA